MLRYKTETRPGLVALYDIRPGNGAGQFLQPRRPREAANSGEDRVKTVILRLPNTVYVHVICKQAYIARSIELKPARPTSSLPGAIFGPLVVCVYSFFCSLYQCK